MTSTGHFTQTQLTGIDAAITRFERNESVRRRLEAEQLVDLATAVEAAVGDRAAPSAARELAYRSLRFELAALLHESEGAVERLLDTAYISLNHFPGALETLRIGAVSLAHVKVITAEGTPLIADATDAGEARRTAYEAAILPIARQESPTRLRPIARQLAAAQHEAEVDERHAQAVKLRHVRVSDAGDGMADLIAYLPAEEAHAIHDRLTRIAKDNVTLQRAAESANLAAQTDGGDACDERSRDERRADALRDLLLDLPSNTQESAGRIRGQIQVVVPIGALGLAAAQSSGPMAPELVGHGPIDSQTAQQLAGEADSWEVIRVNVGGEVLSVDRYRPTPEIRRHFAARDLHCRAPGCNVAAYRCDIDHTVDAALGGPTSTDNLAHLCRSHHTVKHHTDWDLTQTADGVMQWTSPTGRVYKARPPSRVRFTRAE